MLHTTDGLVAVEIPEIWAVVLGLPVICCDTQLHSRCVPLGPAKPHSPASQPYRALQGEL